MRAELENHGPVPRVVGVRVTVFDAGHAVVAASDSGHEGQPGAQWSRRGGRSPCRHEAPPLERPGEPLSIYCARRIKPLGGRRRPGAVSDAVEQPLGLRSFTVDPNKGFILNGEYLNLYGFNRHQDWPDKGWAISDDEEAQDFALMMETGATAVRASHYQQSDSWYERCDRAGIVAWAEIPSWGHGLATPEYLESAKQQLRELIRQNFNHPSICFWGVGNETKGPASESVIVALAPVVRGGGSGPPFNLRLRTTNRRTPRTGTRTSSHSTATTGGTGGNCPTSRLGSTRPTPTFRRRASG